MLFFIVIGVFVFGLMAGTTDTAKGGGGGSDSDCDTDLSS